MKSLLIASSLIAVAACADRANVVALATKLTNLGGGEKLSQQYRKEYIACGIEALSPVPDAKINAALVAADAPTIWAILGSDALDRYVRTCRTVGLKRQHPT